MNLITPQDGIKLEDKTLLTEAQKHPDQFSLLYLKYRTKVFHYFFSRISQDADMAEDLTQETFMRAFRSLSHFQYQGYGYLTYLLTIAHNLLVNYYRAQKTISLESITYLPSEAIIEHKGEYENKIDISIVWQYVRHLSSIEQSVLELKYQQDYSVKTIAHYLNKTPNAVKIILSRARKKLKKKCVANRRQVAC